MEEKIFEEFANEILTVEDLAFLLDEISILENLIFQNPDLPLSQKSKGKISKKLLILVEKLEKEEFFYQKPEKEKEFLENLKNYLLKIPRIKIEIAFEPEREFIREIANFFEKFLKRKIVLDIKVNPKIVGGIVFELEGKIFDFSLAKEIEKIIFQKI